MVIRSLDLVKANEDAETMRYSAYPDYLYDDNALNDINYLLNCDILFFSTAPALFYTITGRSSTTFDEYSRGSNRNAFRSEAVLGTYERPALSLKDSVLSEEERARTEENIRKNVAETVKNNPDIDFYYFLTPYSIVYWDGVVRRGELDRQ